MKRKLWNVVLVGLLSILFLNAGSVSADLKEVKERGVLRHMGLTYANFVTGEGDSGLDIEMIKAFAKHLGVNYTYVPSNWQRLIPDLIGKEIKVRGDEVEVVGECEIKADLIANGVTMLPWREKMVAFSKPVFPTQVWLVTRRETSFRPLLSSGNIAEDIIAVKNQLKGKTVLALPGTCLDPKLYNLEQYGANVIIFNGQLNDIAGALMNGMAESTILDVPDCLVALATWSDRVVVIGPVSPEQKMGVGFSRESPELLKAFNAFYDDFKASKKYIKLVKKYYPAVFAYYGDFFK